MIQTWNAQAQSIGPAGWSRVFTSLWASGNVRVIAGWPRPRLPGLLGLGRSADQLMAGCHRHCRRRRHFMCRLVWLGATIVAGMDTVGANSNSNRMSPLFSGAGWSRGPTPR